MLTNRMESIELLASNSLDRDDLLSYPISSYPPAYKQLQKRINQVFEKSELLLKCKLKFNQLVRTSISEKDALNSQLNMNLIITGTVKAGKSSFLNLLLNSKIVPPGIIGSSICMELFHPKNDNKTISIGVHEWSGWEINKYTDLSVEELPQKLLDIQKKLTTQVSSSPSKSQSEKKIIKVQLPHWFLKNTTIYKCASIDGIYSFNEPFELIEMSQNPILLHVIDASNGIMEWDRTFLSRIKYLKPNLPIFFIINRVDIDMDIIHRDNLSMRFDTSIDHYILHPSNPSTVVHQESTSTPSTTMDSESDCNSNDTSVSTGNIARKQDCLIKRSKSQIMKIGFAICNGSFVSSAAFSAKQFTKYLQEQTYTGEYAEKMKEINENFFEAIQNFLSKWYWKILVTNLMRLKSRVNGIVESVLCDISMQQHPIDHEILSSLFIKDITKRDRQISDMISKTTANIEKEILRVIKEQIMKYERYIDIRKDQIRSDDLMKAFSLMQPVIHHSIENILLSNHEYTSRKKRFSSTNKTPRTSSSSMNNDATNTNVTGDTTEKITDAFTITDRDSVSLILSPVPHAGADRFRINDEIIRIISKNLQNLDTEMHEIRKQQNSTGFRSRYLRDMYQLFKVLQSTIVYPHIVEIPNEILTNDRTRLEEFKIKLKRTFIRNDLQEADILKFAINSITVEPLIGITLESIRSIGRMIQQYGQMYQKTYKIARGLNLQKPFHLNELITCDFLLNSIYEISDRGEISQSNLTRLQGFINPFYELSEKTDEMFMECSSTSFLSLEPFCPGLWLRRVGLSANKRLFLQKKFYLKQNNKCLMNFPKLNFDLYSRIKMKPIWTPYQIGSIILQLVEIARDIQHFDAIFPLRFELTNIYLRQDEDQYSCFYHPFSNPIRKMATKVESDTSSPLSPCMPETDVVVRYRESLIYQLGVIMLHLLLNDESCRFLLPYHNTPYTPEDINHFRKSIEEKIHASDKQYDSSEGTDLFRNESYNQSRQELISICQRIVINCEVNKKEPITSLEILNKELERFKKKGGR